MDGPAQMDSLQRDWPATREEGLRRLEAFAPRMGGHYKSRRNQDLGPDARDNVSLLSPYLRRRLVTEEEAVGRALAAHSASACEKFVQEVFWRGYFKGWLERRPSVWTAYRQGLARDRARLAEDRALAKRVERAEAGATGLDCFDAWAAELAETGYLHNHARMWFASLWIFTFDLPWRLGADFFLRHLLDGDPASNTLGWRWVSGLHTKGKAYEAQAWNIAKFTGGRFSPERGELAEDVVPLEEPGDLPTAAPARLPEPPEPDRPTALLIHEDDCRPEDLVARPEEMVAAATLRASHGRSPREVAEAVAAFDAGALADAAARMRGAGAPGASELVADRPHRLVEWAKGAGAMQILTPFVPVGPVRDFLDRAQPELARAGIRLAEIRRDWDSLTWPHATAGFFKVKKQIPKILSQLG